MGNVSSSSTPSSTSAVHGSRRPAVRSGSGGGSSGRSPGKSQRRVWLLAQKGDAKALHRAIARLPADVRRARLEYATPMDLVRPLAVATLNGHTDCVRVLIEAGAEQNRRSMDGKTPLHVAARDGRTDIARLLISAGADCNVRDARGDTPLLLAAHHGKHEVLDLLLNTQAVNVFARGTTSGWDVFKEARSALNRVDAAQQPQYKKCLELIEWKLLKRLGWVYEYAAPGHALPKTWLKRYYMIFRTSEPSAVKIDLFPALRGGRSTPSLQLVFHASDHIQESSEPIPPEDQRDFRFTLRSYSTTNDAAPPQCFEFAATNQAEYDFWTNFQVSLWGVGSMFASPSVNAESSRPRRLSVPTEEELTDDMSADPSNLENSGVGSPSAAEDFVEETSVKRTADGATECVVCYDAHQTVVCVPCGHIAMCMSCAKQVMLKTRVCPVCRVRVREIVKIFRV